MLIGSVTAPLPTHVAAVVIGASAGAVGALGEILPALPARTPWPVVVVVHLPPCQPSAMPSLFARKCAVAVREPIDKERLGPGIWFAPPDYHLLIESDRTFSLSIDPPLNFSRPSIDVLFQSAAEVYGAALVGVVLTGASADGADGARAIRERGGFVMVQSPETAEEPVMPESAIERASPQRIVTLPEIASALRTMAERSA